MALKVVLIARGEQLYCCSKCCYQGLDVDAVALMVQQVPGQSTVIKTGVCADHARALGFDGLDQAGSGQGCSYFVSCS